MLWSSDFPKKSGMYWFFGFYELDDGICSWESRPEITTENPILVIVDVDAYEVFIPEKNDIYHTDMDEIFIVWGMFQEIYPPNNPRPSDILKAKQKANVD